MQALSNAGYRVLCAASGDDALALCRKEPPELVILGNSLPEDDGLRACAKLRDLDTMRDLPVLMLTRAEDDLAVDQAFEAGATDFAFGTITPAQLLHRVRYLLRAATRLADLRVSESRLATMQRTARLGSWEFDPTSGNFNLSDHSALLMGLQRKISATSLVSVLSRVHLEDRDELKAAFQSAVEEGKPFSMDCRVYSGESSTRFLHCHAEIEDPRGGPPHQLVGTFQDISDKKTAERKIRFLAFFDSLTGLPNRTQFGLQLKTTLESAKRRGGLVALLFIDLDHFKRINDSLGHESGDLLIKQVAVRLREAMNWNVSTTLSVPSSHEGIVARLGGDEFILALSDLSSPGDAARVGMRILDLLKQPFLINSREMIVSASIGISVHPQDGEDAESLLKHADRALYHAKDSGRNNFQFYSPALNASALERLSLESSLRRALDNDQFVLHYQPQVNPCDGAIVGAEALIRWNHPELGVVPPARFIPLCEEIGLIREVGTWVMREACRQARDWRERGFGAPRIAVNVSAIQFKSADFAQEVVRIVREHGLDPSQIEIELTEGLLMEPDSQAVETLRVLNESGFRLSLDDFGTGYSSLAYLKRFSIDTLKIDRSFVQDLEHDANDRAIVASFLALAGGLGIETVAEGVETLFQRDYLLELGCEVMQGYLFGRPTCAEEFEELLQHYDAGSQAPRTRLAPDDVEELITLIDLKEPVEA